MHSSSEINKSKLFLHKNNTDSNMLFATKASAEGKWQTSLTLLSILIKLLTHVPESAPGKGETIQPTIAEAEIGGYSDTLFLYSAPKKIAKMR